ncbi:MAG: hypothetical protein R3F17_13490 [Planctomycetota bacterium]
MAAFVGLAATSLAPLSAQGSQCSAAVPISGEGIFPFDTTNGGSHGLPYFNCNSDFSNNTTNEGWFLWTANQSGPVRFEVDSPDGNRHINVLEGCNDFVCADPCHFETIGGVQVAYSGLVSVDAGDTLLVVIYQRTDLPGNAAGGPGELRVGGLPCASAGSAPDALEPNQDCPGAAPLAVGTYTDLTCQAGDPDFYTVTIAPGHESQVTLVDGAEVMLARLGANCTQSPTFDPTFTVTNLSGEPVTEYFAVVIDGVHPCGNYELVISDLSIGCDQPGGTDDAFEPNDACGSAPPIAPGTHTNLWAGQADLDYYSFDVPPRSYLEVQLNTEGAIRFFDMNCEELLGMRINPNHNFRHNDTDQVETVVIEVGPGVLPCLTYDMQVSTFSDDCTNGPGLFSETGINYYRTLANGVYGDIDPLNHPQFKVTVMPGDTLTVSASNPAGIPMELSLCAGWVICQFGLYSEQVIGNPATITLTNSGVDPMEPGFDAQPIWVGNEYDPCVRFDLEISGLSAAPGIPEVQTYCDPASVHSGGQSAQLLAWGDNGLTGNSIQLECVQGPAGQFGYFLGGTVAHTTGIQISGGRLCLDPLQGVLGRYNQFATPLGSLGQFDQFGRLKNLEGTSAYGFGYSVPTVTPWGALITGGQTLYFQLWFRDQGGLSNFSNALQVTF